MDRRGLAATYHALYDGTEYATPYRSFADAFSSRMGEIDQYGIVDETASWISTVERNCRVTATKQIVLNLCNHVAVLAEEAALAMAAAVMESDIAPSGELKYLTPSQVGDHDVQRRRHGAYTDVNMLRAQAQGIVDALTVQSGYVDAMTQKPRTLDGFCERLGIVRK